MANACSLHCVEEETRQREAERERERHMRIVDPWESSYKTCILRYCYPERNNRLLALLQSPNKQWGGPGGRGVAHPSSLAKEEREEGGRGSSKKGCGVLIIRMFQVEAGEEAK